MCNVHVHFALFRLFSGCCYCCWCVCVCVVVTFKTIANSQYHLYKRLIYAHAISHLSRDHAPPDFLIQIILSINLVCMQCIMIIDAIRTTILHIQQHLLILMTKLTHTRACAHIQMFSLWICIFLCLSAALTLSLDANYKSVVKLCCICRWLNLFAELIFLNTQGTLSKTNGEIHIWYLYTWFTFTVCAVDLPMQSLSSMSILRHSVWFHRHGNLQTFAFSFSLSLFLWSQRSKEKNEHQTLIIHSN